jgi:hypothetical protein
VNEDEKRWEVAVANAREMLEAYKEIPTGVFGALMIQRDIDLYEAGDRSEALLESLEKTE